ncbi:glycosyltransferase family 2 protein [Flavisolibacter tropicus]|uniref:Glycosyl transferase family 2 n=1 Tax=Flavisolibacter tropicus TaxID=1492898 RepID=A0A172TQK7_9BACT|nr:glycosyltransferase family 2 protein [Flavisolibacter tropicus]ANE49266.1 glycosyl transferase family 2 [Flavisolibacter tropicus]
MISVVILTKNEEVSLPSCLASLSWCDDIHVLDSGSTDKTNEIAKMFGANTYVHPFEGFGKQRNYALDNLDFKNEWILFLDADEHSTEKFREAIYKEITKATNGVAGFYCCSKLMLEGRWLKRSDTFPIWQFRLLRKGRARFTNLGHGQKECDLTGEVKYIKEGYLHYSISKGWFEWINRHNIYAKKEAAFRYYNCPPFRNIFVRHASMRRIALKCWLTKSLIWPFLRFIHAYFFKLGFLEGIQGLLYCVNNFYYEFMISIQYRELKRNEIIANGQRSSPILNIKSDLRLVIHQPDKSQISE